MLCRTSNSWSVPDNDVAECFCGGEHSVEVRVSQACIVLVGGRDVVGTRAYFIFVAVLTQVQFCRAHFDRPPSYPAL